MQRLVFSVGRSPRSFTPKFAPSLFESEPATCLLQSILNAQETAEGHIQLPDSIKWPIIDHNILFKRDFYADCFRGPLSSFNPSCPSKKFIVNGNSGVAKSAFALYLLYRALHSNRTVLFESRSANSDDEINYLFKDGKAYLYSTPEEIAAYTSDSNTVYICDESFALGNYNAFQVLIASHPAIKEMFATQYGNHGKRIMIPSFSFDEIQEMHHSCYKDKFPEEEVVWSRYDVCGGNAKKVFDDSKSDEMLQTELKESIESIGSMKDFLINSAIYEKLAEDHPIHKLMHYEIRGRSSRETQTYEPSDMKYYELTDEKIDFASDFIGDELMDYIVDKDAENVDSYITSAGRIPGQ